MAFAIDKKRIARNTVMLYLRMAVTMLIGFFTSRVTLQQLGVDDFGLNNLLSSVVAMLSFLNGSMGTAVQRFFSIEIGQENETSLKRVFSVGLYLHLIVALLTLVLAEVFALGFLDRLQIPPNRLGAARIVFQVAAMSLVANIALVPYTALLRAREQFSQTALVEMVQALLRLLVLYLLVVLPYDKLVSLSLLNFGVTIYYVVSIVLLALRFPESHSGPRRDPVLIRQMLGFISMLIVTVLAQLLHLQGVQLLVNLFFSLSMNAAYGVAIQVYSFVNSFVMNFKHSMVPQLVASYGAGDREGMFKLLDAGTKITFILLLLLSFPLVFEAETLLRIWLKEAPEHAARLVALMVINVNIYSFSYFYNQAVQASGRIVWQQSVLSATFLLSIVAVFCCFQCGAGIDAALYVALLCSVAQVANNLYFCRRILAYRIRHFLRHILLPCLLCVVLVALPLGLLRSGCAPGWPRLIASILLSTSLTLICGYFLILNGNERKILVSLIPHKRKKA